MFYRLPTVRTLSLNDQMKLQIFLGLLLSEAKAENFNPDFNEIGRWSNNIALLKSEDERRAQVFEL